MAVIVRYTDHIHSDEMPNARVETKTSLRPVNNTMFKVYNLKQIIVANTIGWRNYKITTSAVRTRETRNDTANPYELWMKTSE